MAVSEMNFISIIGPMRKIDELINICGESGVFQPDNVFSFYSRTENFSAIAEENPYSEPLQTLRNAVYSCGGKLENADTKNFQVNKAKISRYVSYISKNMENLVDEKRDLYKKLAFYKEEIEKLQHFYGLDQNLKDVLSCECVKARFGKIPIASYEKLPEITEKGKKNGIDIMFFTFTSDKEYHWGLYFADLENENEIDRLFSSIYFEEVPMKPYDKNPYEQVTEFQNLRKELYKKVEVVDKRISDFWGSQKGQCMKFYTKLKELSTCFEIKAYAAKYNDSFILVGWVPQENLKEFSQKISKVQGVEYSTEKGKNILEHMPPVKLENKKLFTPFEFFIDTYGMPSYNEIDPTPFVAVTYTILFGIMFADLGQGLVVSLLGFLMWKFKKMKLGKILIPCGISSAIFGTLFGSVFGFEHALDSFYHAVFGLKEKPIEVMDSSTTSVIIYSAVGLGIILLIIAMGLGIYSSVKRQNYGEAIFGSNGLCGFIFYTAAVFMMLDTMTLHTGISNSLFVLTFLIIPLVLLMFREMLIKLVNKEPDWKPESWGDYIAQNFFELFEVILSYVTNTMSFLRVGAFVLVHAGMMMVVFTIAGMFSGVGYVIAMIIGNVFVIALEALLAGIQVLRLEFYEIFSKFFEGQGRTFTPVTVKESIS
jgi:V/A-type H+-transporting ATPase subunit I